MKRGIAGVMVALVVAGACTSPRPPAQAASPDPGPASARSSGSGLPVVPMDSATIERLCAKPDMVRAGIAECVLKDQSPPVTPVRRTSPPPP